jgi:hypothetical protein
MRSEERLLRLGPNPPLLEGVCPGGADSRGDGPPPGHVTSLEVDIRTLPEAIRRRRREALQFLASPNGERWRRRMAWVLVLPCPWRSGSHCCASTGRFGFSSSRAGPPFSSSSGKPSGTGSPRQLDSQAPTGPCLGWPGRGPPGRGERAPGRERETGWMGDLQCLWGARLGGRLDHRAAHETQGVREAAQRESRD